MDTMTISASDYAFVRKLVRDRSAIALEDEKTYLAEARLGSLARREGFGSLGDLFSVLRANQPRGLEQKIVEAMTTNESSFFRDVHPFEALRKSIIPRLIERRGAERSLRIWSAACSSGQEPYSIAMILADHFPAIADWNVTILATDLSTEMLERARRATFSQLEVNRGLPAPLLIKHFEKKAAEWQLKPRVRDSVQFRQLNLNEPWPLLPQFDVIFLRNVLIYFENDTKKQILARIANQLRLDGALFLGGAETTLNLDESYHRSELEKATWYQLRSN